MSLKKIYIGINDIQYGLSLKMFLKKPRLYDDLQNSKAPMARAV